MKRILCLLCALSLAACLLAACGKSGPAPPPPTDAPTTEAANNQGGEFNNFSEVAEAWNQLGQMFSAGWPENEFTKLVPTPKFETTLGLPIDDGFGALTVASVDELKDYVKDLKKAGFDKSAETTDESFFGVAVYNYTATNNKGYTVEVIYSMGMSAITIKKAMG